MLREGKIPIEYERDTRSVMRTLAYNSGQVAPRYQVLPGTLHVEDRAIAHGSCSEVREGRFNDRIVAVKTLKVKGQDVLKVRGGLL